jgi:hypothetical protein
MVSGTSVSLAVLPGVTTERNTMDMTTEETSENRALLFQSLDDAFRDIAAERARAAAAMVAEDGSPEARRWAKSYRTSLTAFERTCRKVIGFCHVEDEYAVHQALTEPDPFTTCVARLDELNAEAAS